MSTSSLPALRIDKWLWAARFYKTRSLAASELNHGRVYLNGVLAKPARDVHVGDTISLRQGSVVRTFAVRGISQQRGGAPVAQLLYEETADSLRLQAEAQTQRQLHPEPASALTQGRPTKRDRRALDKAQGRE